MMIEKFIIETKKPMRLVLLIDDKLVVISRAEPDTPECDAAGTDRDTEKSAPRTFNCRIGRRYRLENR